LADAVGQEIAAAVLASASRPYDESSRPFEGMAFGTSDDSSDSLSQKTYEQQTILEHEEREWHKSVRKEAAMRKSQLESETPSSTNDEYTTKLFTEEREWIDEVVIDPRIASRMHRYFLSPEEEARANRIASGQEWILGEGEKPKELPFWQRTWIKYGYGEDPALAKKKPIIGNLDNEDGE
jgi:import inner membrane translocase subunit TIM54